MEGVLLGVVGVALAIAVPLYVEYSRRPDLRVGRADDANSSDQHSSRWRFVHVRVINRPLTGWRARWLLRNDATGCRVQVVFKSRSDGREVRIDGRWSATAEPVTQEQGGSWVFDMTKLPQTLRLDLVPDDVGELLAIAIKYDGDEAAYAFSSWNFSERSMRPDSYELPDTEYDVTVTAKAGEIRTSATYVLQNSGDRRTGLALRASL